MLKNNKGFMLAEVVITSTVVMTGLIGLYTSFNRLYKEYEVRSRYYNIDGVYASRNMIKHLINNGELNTILRENLYTNNYIYLIKTDSSIDSTDQYINSLQDFYNIRNMIIIEWNESTVTSVVNELKNDNTLNETFKDYLEDYVVKHYDFGSKTDYNYLIITEYQTENSSREEYNYSSISLR